MHQNATLCGNGLIILEKTAFKNLVDEKKTKQEPYLVPTLGY